MGIVGVTGNVVTFIVIVSNESMHTGTNFYLLNLAWSDLIVLSLYCPVSYLIPEKGYFTCVLR